MKSAIPEGWYECYDESHQQHYYVHSSSGVSQWEFPSENTFIYEPKESRYPGKAVENINYNRTVLPYQRAESAFPTNEEESLEDMTLDRKKDYIGFAMKYKIERPYADPNFKAPCVICERRICSQVFYPCEHKCVCNSCIKSNKICEEREFSIGLGDHCNCSLCGSVILRIFLSEGGDEAVRYWAWVYEESPPLPKNFRANFRRSAGVLKAVHGVNTEDDYSLENASEKCNVS